MQAAGWLSGGVIYKSSPVRHKYMLLVGFGRACAPVRCAHPSFWVHATPNRALRAPPQPIAASMLFIHTPKIKIIHRTRAARVKGFFPLIYHRGLRVPRLISSRPNWVPHPLTCKRVLLPPSLDPRGETCSLSEYGVGGTNSDDGEYTLVLKVNQGYEK
jgi:hypothetical protein